MRVLYLLNFAGKAGTERYVETLARTLGNDGRIEPFFAYHIDGLLAQRMERMGVPTRRLEMKSRFDKQAARALAELCKEWNIDVIHTHYLRENYIALLSKQWNPQVKVIYTSHFIQKNNWYTRWSNRIMSRKQDGVISVCTAGKEQLVQNGLDAPNIKVVFNGVDPDIWSPQEGGHSTLRQELDLPEDTFVMLCASRFADDKGHDFLIDAIQLLKEAVQKPFHLVLAGDGPLLQTIQEKVRACRLEDVVTFLGFREDMGNLFHGSDLYINSSRHEALSFLIIEALASGLPVIATAMGGNGDIINEETHCGLLVQYNNPASMAAAMKTLLEHPQYWKEFHEGALEAAQTTFHIDRMVDSTYEVYRHVVTEGRLGGPRLRGMAAIRQKRAAKRQKKEAYLAWQEAERRKRENPPPPPRKTPEEQKEEEEMKEKLRRLAQQSNGHLTQGSQTGKDKFGPSSPLNGIAKTSRTIERAMERREAQEARAVAERAARREENRQTLERIRREGKEGPVEHLNGGQEGPKPGKPKPDKPGPEGPGPGKPEPEPPEGGKDT